MKIYLLLILIPVFTGCDLKEDEEDPETEIMGKERRLPGKMVYNYDCLKKDTGTLSKVWKTADDVIGKVATFNIEVSDEEQVAFGEQFMAEAAKDENFIIDAANPENIP